MACIVSSPTEIISSVCLDGANVENLQKNLEEAVVSMRQQSPVERFAIISEVDGIFHSKKSRAEAVEACKQALQQIHAIGSWRSALLRSFFEKKIKVMFPFHAYDNHLGKSLEYSDRVQELRADELTALFGSTFSTNKPHRLSNTGDHLLDSAHAGICRSANGSFQGYALALGDGSGGHFGDTAQDKRIAKVAHLAVKWSVEIFSAYEDPTALKQAIPSFIPILDSAIQNRIWGEGTTLLCCRVFLMKGGYRVVGFNIGDTMLCSWNKAKKKLQTLAPSYASEAGTAIFPSAYRSEEIMVFDEALPYDSTLILMTDGVHDTLPHEEKEGKYRNGLRFRKRTLSERVLDHKSGGERDDEIPFLLMRQSIEGGERLRQSSLRDDDVQIGDDGALLSCRLKRPGP